MRTPDIIGHVLVFDVAFGHPVNLSQWGGLDYEIAFYSYRFAGEDHIQPALIDKLERELSFIETFRLESEGEAFTDRLVSDEWSPELEIHSLQRSGGYLLNGRGDFRDRRSINFSDSVAAMSSIRFTIRSLIDWNDPVFFDGQPYTFYPVYRRRRRIALLYKCHSYSARVAVAFNRYGFLVSGNFRIGVFI